MADYIRDLENFPDANHWYAAKTLGLEPATLAAMARRGLVEVQKRPSKCNLYRRVSALGSYQKIVKIAKMRDTDLLSLKDPNAHLGMLCQIKAGLIYDCWGNQLPSAEVNKFQLIWDSDAQDWVSLEKFL